MNKFKYYLVIVIVLISYNCIKAKKEGSNELVESKAELFRPWQEGYLDIHHINTGRGDATFMVLPDGTTLLFDAGDLDKDKFEHKYAPLKASPPKPSDSLTAAQYIALYIKDVMTKGEKPEIDYVLISHFHEDHYGSFVDLEKLVPMKKVIDRNYPDYNFPLDLKKYLSSDSLFQDYQKFISKKDLSVEALIVGSNAQLVLLRQPEKFKNFSIRNVKSNGTIWTGNAEETFDYFSDEDMTDYYKGKYNENPLSLAIKISYGNFDYFTGGDNTGLQGFGLPQWFDVETPMAKAVGNVEVTTLDHHGNRDATNEYFVKTLDPKVVVQQSWCSDHPGQEVYQRLIYKDENAQGRDIFATNMHDETLVTYGPWFKDNYKSMHGHILIRVYPNGDTYDVYVLNDDTTTLTVKEKFGPYKSK
ncbi:ComEC/Rec2 family competence protein [Snuella lapsa]|uniref:Metallo-beta-lactamase domain-containing protein n=1 Tax=Snuella lapsa TaxID=870481 RepID=A0ABP6YBN3_9FLAO